MSVPVETTRRPNIQRWMLVIGLLSVLPMLLFLVLVGRALMNQQQIALEVELQQQADFGAGELAREVRVVFATLDSLATSDAAIHADYAALHAHATRIVALSPRIGAITAIDAEGVRRFSTLAPFAVTLPPIVLGEFDKLALATGTRQISPLSTGSISGKKLVSFSVPVKVDNKTIMIVRVAMWTEAIGEIVYERPVPSTWIATVIDQNMIQIARSKDAARFVGLPPTEFTQSAILAGRTTPYAAVTSDGVAMTASIVRVAGTPWIVAVGAPATSMQAELWKAFQSTLWIGLICVALSLLGVWVVALKIRDEILRATDVSKSSNAPPP